MPAPYSFDLRQKAIQSIDQGRSVCEVSRLFNISRNTLYAWLKRRRDTGSIEPTQNYHNPHNRQIHDLEHFQEFVSTRRDWTQAELGQLYGVSAKVVGRALKKIAWSRKKKTNLYKERDEKKRATFKAEKEKKKDKPFKYIDECGCDERMYYEYAYSEIGEKVQGERQGTRGTRTSMIGAYGERKLESVVTFEGSCNRTVVEIWLEEQLLPTWEEGTVIVMDNASFHKGGKIRELIEGKGCH